MYFWSVSDLKQHLIARPLTEREQLPYLLIFVTLSSIGAFVPTDWSNVWDVALVVWTVALALLGTIYLFRQNGGSSGGFFLQRYFALGFVVAVRWVAALLVAAIPFYVAIGVFGWESEATTWPDFIFFALAELLLYQRIGKHMGEVATRSAAA